MADISLEYVQKHFDPRAVFIVTKSLNPENVVVYATDGENGIRTYWLCLEDDEKEAEMSLLERRAFCLTWPNNNQAYVQRIGADRTLTFNESLTECWTDIAGAQQFLAKIHVEINADTWSLVPDISHFVVQSKNPKVSEVVYPPPES
jgi:hypothetical protein